MRLTDAYLRGIIRDVPEAYAVVEIARECLRLRRACRKIERLGSWYPGDGRQLSDIARKALGTNRRK